MAIIKTGFCQEPAPPVDNTPLERPQPLFIMEHDSGSQLLTQISDTLKQHGFEIVKLDKRDMLIESTKRISDHREDYDKVIIWLERDYMMPENYIKVYFLFGRFLEIVSFETRIKRIEISTVQEENIIGELKKSLISISL
jgi:hypothetical protein